MPPDTDLYALPPAEIQEYLSSVRYCRPFRACFTVWLITYLTVYHAFYIERDTARTISRLDLAGYLEILRPDYAHPAPSSHDSTRPTYDLPTELKSIIASFIDSPHTHAQLRAASKAWFSVSTTSAFSTVYLNGPLPSWSSLDAVEMEKLRRLTWQKEIACACFLDREGLRNTVQTVVFRRWAFAFDRPCWWSNFLMNVSRVKMIGFTDQTSSVMSLFPSFILPRTVTSLHLASLTFGVHSLQNLLGPRTRLLNLTMHNVEGGHIVGLCFLLILVNLLTFRPKVSTRKLLCLLGIAI